MIIGEALKKVFAGLTLTIAGKSTTVQFHYGDQKELNHWISLQDKVKKTKYPLIWYVITNPEPLSNDKFKVSTQLILFQLTKPEVLNTTRTNTTYLNSLNPLYELVNKTLKQHPFISVMSDGKPIKYKDEPNFGVKKADGTDFEVPTSQSTKSITLDVVDAKILQIIMVVRPQCIT